MCFLPFLPLESKFQNKTDTEPLTQGLTLHPATPVQSERASRGLSFVDTLVKCAAGRRAATVAALLPSWITGTYYFDGKIKHRSARCSVALYLLQTLRFFPQPYIIIGFGPNKCSLGEFSEQKVCNIGNSAYETAFTFPLGENFYTDRNGSHPLSRLSN